MRIEAISRPRSAPTRSICRFCDPIIARVFRRPCRCRGRHGSRGHHRCDRCRPDRSALRHRALGRHATRRRRAETDRRPSWHPCLASHSCPVPSRQRRDRPEGCQLPSAVGRRVLRPRLHSSCRAASAVPSCLHRWASSNPSIASSLSSPPARQPLLSSRRASGARRWLPAPRSAHWQASQGPAAPMYYSVYPSLRAWKAARRPGWESATRRQPASVSGLHLRTEVASRSSSEETGSD